MIQIGDTVRFLNTTGGGRVVRLDGRMAYVEDQDGFEIPVLTGECVVVQKAGDTPKETTTKNASVTSLPDAKSIEPTSRPVPESMHDISETKEGDRLNLMLVYEPLNIKELSTTTFDAFIINDSNYYLYICYMTAPADPLVESADSWQNRFDGLIEPNTQVWLGEVLRSELASLERICVQATAFKRDKLFVSKPPVEIVERPDVTKFCRLHCFKTNEYCDSPVIAIPLIRDDKVMGRQIPQKKEVETLDAMFNTRDAKSKIRADRRKTAGVQRRTQPAHPELPQPGADGIIEVDLHIDALLDNTAGMSPADMLNYQVDYFRKVMDANVKRHNTRIVFIHGKGEGVLRQALMREFTHRYKGHDVQDASFHQYGFGATQVTIR